MSKAQAVLLILEEDQSSFDLKHFKSLSTSKECLKYASQTLQKLGTGSARVVYDLGDGKVLKISKNQKGVAQNDAECDYSIGTPYVARSLDCNEDNLWIIAERADKITTATFKKIVGVDFKTYSEFLTHEYVQTGRSKYAKTSMTLEQAQELWENDFCSDMASLMADYDMPMGDLKRINSYGILNRKGKDLVVLRDYGLTEEIYKTHY